MKHPYKKSLLLFFFFFHLSFLKAQWVTIPDTTFVSWLNTNGYASCMNGNLMDTTCSAVVSDTLVDCHSKNIHSLDGIQYFDNLKHLVCYQDSLTGLPGLPGGLKILECFQNQIINLPNLPDSLTELVCYDNQITSLPSLPINLTVLNVGNNQLTSLPPLPNFLITLSCDLNALTSLPALPLQLQNFSCAANQLTTIPLLPTSLHGFFCGSNMLTSLPSLPNTITNFDCAYNQISNLPSLPDSLGYLSCEYNLLTFLPALPAKLDFLRCKNNQLINLPQLPSVLTWLLCDENQLTSLPVLPDTLTYLSCSDNLLSSLPALPDHLYNFNCNVNVLTSLPLLPSSLRGLSCASNQLTSLPELPDTLNSLHIYDNPNLVCLPELKRISTFNFTSTGIQCLPNYGNITTSYPPLSSLPLCDLFNTNNCTVYWNISGKVYNDTNNNCIAENNELRLSNFKLMLDSAGTLIRQTYTGGEGFYSFDTDTGTYTYTVDTTDLPVLVTCPASGFQTSVLTTADSMDYSMDFGMQCKPGFDVGVTSVLRDSGVFRPAQFARVRISAGDISNFYGLHCAAGTGGTVQVIFNGSVSYIGASAGALTPVVSGDTLLYTIADFGIVNFNSDFSFTMQTDTTAVIGSQVCFHVNVSPTGDINPANNLLQHCFTVINSIDPNTKEVSPEGNMDTSQNWLTYTINFQNTGTAPAQHIYILDTLDNSLDESSFTLLAYSHQPLTQVLGKIIRFNFPNINLPDSTNDEPHSHGYVQYKVKLKTGLTNGTLIHNTAHIIFDFNSPVTTNTTENQIFITTGVEGFMVPGLKFQVAPNPFHDYTVLKIKSEKNINNGLLEIYNVIGEKVKEANFHNKNEIVIERKNLEKGIYIFKLLDEKMMIGTGKLVIQ